jgi:hypothetical protein
MEREAVIPERISKKEQRSSGYGKITCPGK